MSTTVQLSIAVGEDAPGSVSLAEAGRIAALAAEVGVAAIRLADAAPGGRAVDPTVAAAYLAGINDGVGYVAEIPTTHNAPYNAARRVLSLDRATGGRIGLALRPGGGDEVSEASAPDPVAGDPVSRWSEYAGVLAALWESFPREALIGDQDAGVVVDDSLIAPIDHEGAFYRVAGPLDGPSSVQGRPVLVADLDALEVNAVAESADVIVVDGEHVEGADAALTAALKRAGRSREEVALLGRVASVPETAWIGAHRLDGIELAPTGGAEAITAALRALEPQSAGQSTLLAAFGLPQIEAVAA